MAHGIPDPEMVAKYGFDLFKNWEPDKPNIALELIQRPGPFRASPEKVKAMLGLSLDNLRSWTPAQINRLGCALKLMGYEQRGDAIRDFSRAVAREDGELFIAQIKSSK